MYRIEKEFLLESNKIEGVYDEQSLTDALEAWKYLLEEKELTIDNILKTHEILMLHQPLMTGKGHFRTQPVWIAGKQGLNHEEIEKAMKKWAKKANRSNIWPKIKEDHIEYERIHPFIDGNGRTGRIFMNWARVKNGSLLLTIFKNEVQGYYNWFDEI